jgi:hypothetical protein
MTTQSERQHLLDLARRAQTEYWDAIRALELAYGSDAAIDDGRDLQDWSIEAIDDEMRDAGFHVVNVIAPGEETK